jgi:DMSO/TMAO reductase YedYZ molybdopterin-dependent catalytic subunit
MRRLSRRGFARGGVAAAAGLLGWAWLRSRSAAGGIPWPLRAAHRLNERVWGGAFSAGRLAPEFPPGRAGEPKANGGYGRPDAADPAAWALTASQPGRPDRTFRLADLAGLPRVEMTTEFKCIEGWSQIVGWGGVRFADFADAYDLGRRAGGDRHPYVSLATPDGAYYVGLDTPSALHPQTLLCDRMNGEPLSARHGGPLRLILTVKYGTKNIKWLSAVAFADDRPADFWAEHGYDWYGGL